MKIINSLSAIVIVGIAIFFFSFNFLLIKINLGEVGVRTKQYAVLGEKGVESKDFAAGWHRNLPVIDTWNVFDNTVQTTEFTSDKERKANRDRNFYFLGRRNDYYTNPSTGPERIELKSKDGFTVQLDVTVKYRIKPGSVHEAYKKFSTEDRYKSIVRDQVQNTLRNILGRMKTEEFYNPVVRRGQIGDAYTELKQDLETNFIDLISILIRDIHFDASYERKILDKKLADQDVELNKSKAVAEEKRGLTNKISAETEAKVRVIEEEKKAAQLTMKAETDKEISQIRADARLKVTRTKADADLYAAGEIAKGILLEKETEARGERLRADALKGPGGSNLVALQIVRDLKLSDMTVSTVDNDFLDVNGMVIKLGASGK